MSCPSLKGRTVVTRMKQGRFLVDARLVSNVVRAPGLTHFLQVPAVESTFFKCLQWSSMCLQFPAFLGQLHLDAYIGTHTCWTQVLGGSNHLIHWPAILDNYMKMDFSAY